LYKSIFAIKTTTSSAEQGIDALVNALQGKVDGEERFLNMSLLFRHECCYLIGQLGADTDDIGLKQRAFDALLTVLTDESEDEVTRHEAAEGIAAIFNNNVEDIAVNDNTHNAVEGDPYERAVRPEESHEGKVGITDYLEEKLRQTRRKLLLVDSASTTSPVSSQDNDELSISSSRPLRSSHFYERNKFLISLLSLYAFERDTGVLKSASPLGMTCYLAIEGLKRDTARVCACQYRSYDPAIGVVGAAAEEIPEYETTLADESKSMYERYVAMFTLRNLGGAEALARCLQRDRSSSILRHEIAFILGQIEDEKAVDALVKNLADLNESGIVRHESAIALKHRQLEGEGSPSRIRN
jgi:hypothetical protein